MDYKVLQTKIQSVVERLGEKVVLNINGKKYTTFGIYLESHSKEQSGELGVISATKQLIIGHIPMQPNVGDKIVYRKGELTITEVTFYNPTSVNLGYRLTVVE